MKAVRLHRYDERPVVDEVPEPTITGPHDLIVRMGGAGLCRTDLHIIEGQWQEKTGVTLPYILGHENAGWVHASIGYGGTLTVPTIDIIATEVSFVGNLVGTYNDLVELMTLAAQGKVALQTMTYPLATVNDAISALESGRLRGRGILVP
jgi:D-arabinose 1-dehydrogenase-like Zn-dependent alcohol dehydrogenase